MEHRYQVPEDEVYVVELDTEGNDSTTSALEPPPPAEEMASSSGLQLATPSEEIKYDRFAEKISGTRREEDDSTIAFGDKFAERFGGPTTMPVPSAPPMPEGNTEEDIRHAQSEWARASTAERKKLPNHELLQTFFNQSGIESRAQEPRLRERDLPEDGPSAAFKLKIAQARVRMSQLGREPGAGDADGGAPVAQVQLIGVEESIKMLLTGTPSPKDYTDIGKVYLPPSLLAQHDLEPALAEAALLANDQFDQVQMLAEETAAMYKSSWVFGEKVAGGTLEVRMNAERSKMLILGEGYKARNLGGAEGWTTIAKGIPKDTEYFHVPGEFTVVRIMPGRIGLCQKTEKSRQIARLLPGRYVLPERMVRYIGVAKTLPNMSVPFTPHPGSQDPDIGRLARRFSSYFLPKGHRLFVNGPDGAFALDPDEQKRPFLFDAKAMEEPLNVVNPRHYLQAASNEAYHIVRLQHGQRIILRDGDGGDVCVEFDEANPSLACNVYHISKTYFDFDGKVYNRDNTVVCKETLSSVRMSPNDVLVLKDADGNVRFLDEFSSQKTIGLRPPWQAIATIPKTKNEYVYENDGLKVARVKPASNQWPIIYDVQCGGIRILPHSIEYIFSSTEEQLYIGMADRNEKEPQSFKVPGVGSIIVAVVNSGQLAMCRLNNMSFFLPPSPEPYVFRPPNEFFGMVDMSSTHVHIPGSDLHRIYVPAGEWAVAMVDGRQVILDPAAAVSGTDEGNGIWIFRAQQLQLGGPVPIDAKCSELFNCTRLQVPMNEIAFGVDSKSGERLIWTPGNHTINKNSGEVFQGFFNTQLEDVKIEQFDVVWNGGVKSTVDASVGFHILSEDPDNQADMHVMRRVLTLCQNQDDLHDKVVENTKHQLFDVIAQIEPLGYGSTMNESTTGVQNKETTLQDLETMFSTHVDTILKKYGIVVDNVTITKIDLDPKFLQRSEEIQHARMDARKKVLVAEQDMQRNQIAQQQALLDQQAKTRSAEETSKQRDIERKREVDDVASRAEAEARADANRKRVAYEATLEQKVAEAENRVKQEELRIQELLQKQKAMEVEMQMRKQAALLEAETKAVEQTAMARAEVQARAAIAEMALSASRFEVEAQKLHAEGSRQQGLAQSAVTLNQQYGGIEQSPELMLELLKLRSVVEGQKAIAEATARYTDPAISRMMGRLESFEEVVPNLCQATSMRQNLFAMPSVPAGLGPNMARANEATMNSRQSTASAGPVASPP